MIITKSQSKTSSWSGGKTTELFIYPQESSYQERNFQIRISSATVEIETSNFTQLSDYNRVLMILSGELEINHQNKYSKKLSRYDCDYFDGGWKTTAKGKVVDFNLMTFKPVSGELKYVIFHANTEVNFVLPENKTLIGLYFVSGKILIKEDNLLLKPKDLLILQNNKEIYSLHVLEESEIIQIYVS